MEKLTGRLVSWIGDTVSTAGGQGVVVGMSGGIDSSVVAALCQRAFPKSTLGVIIPCYGDRVDREHAELVATSCGIPVEVAVLDEAFDALVKALSSRAYSLVTKELAEANIKPRLRMVALYYFANRLNYLVVGAGNRSELSVGYFTKYGDGGVDLLPLGNLLKSQVRDLAEYLKIPREIIDKPPSAGLWAGQTDEAELGVTYRELDNYLATGDGSGEVKEKIDSMINRSSHKRRTPPAPLL